MGSEGTAAAITPRLLATGTGTGIHTAYIERLNATFRSALAPLVRRGRALVVRPKIPQGRGIFAEKSETRIWLSDDAQRLVLAIQSNFSFGQVTLKLKDYVVPGATQQ